MAVRLATKTADTIHKLREILNEARWEGTLTHKEFDELERYLRVSPNGELVHSLHRKR